MVLLLMTIHLLGGFLSRKIFRCKTTRLSLKTKPTDYPWGMLRIRSWIVFTLSEKARGEAMFDGVDVNRAGLVVSQWNIQKSEWEWIMWKQLIDEWAKIYPPNWHASHAKVHSTFYVAKRDTLQVNLELKMREERKREDRGCGGKHSFSNTLKSISE